MSEDDQPNYRQAPAQVRDHLQTARAHISAAKGQPATKPVKPPQIDPRPPETPGDPVTNRRMMSLAQILAGDLNLNREDRLALAEVLLRTDCVSWSNLTQPQLSRVIDAMYGHVYITELQTQGATNVG
jgi:hypothetical protein